MSHHYSGPDFGFPHGDARLDLTDVFAFPKPGADGKSILIMNVHPSSSIVPLQATTVEPFSTEALYEFKIDTDGDAVADLAYRIRFSSAAGGTQTATLRRVDGKQAAGTDDSGAVIVEGVPVSHGREARIAEALGYRFFAGWRSDPFFFDPLGALNGFRFSADFFTDKDVCSIVLEVPNPVLGSKEIGLWARTVDGAGGRWIQADRGGRPSQAVFLSGDEKSAYLAAEPAGDARFIATFAHSLQHAGGYPLEEAQRVARGLLPDILRYDPNRAASYPKNGRALTDDVQDGFLAILTNGKVTTDGIGPHGDLLAEFPYLGLPHGAGIAGASN
jgi:hypothetical protein